MNEMILTPGAVPLGTLRNLYWLGGAPRLTPDCAPAVARAAARIAEVAAGDAAVYGVNTGFGKLASIRIAAGDVAQLQRNLILSHC
ncbi:MAG: aromatic amino acid lyase, partial [Paracoccaceae bacterium]